MKAKDLIPLLQKYPDAEIVVGASDHHYRIVQAHITNANYNEQWDDLIEYYGAEKGYEALSVILID